MTIWLIEQGILACLCLTGLIVVGYIAWHEWVDKPH